MFFTSILMKALQHFVGRCSSEEEDAADGCIGSRDTGEARADRFSELPDALLLDILERLDTLQAVRACVLSNHLLKLPAMLSRVVIDVWYASHECEDPTELDLHDMVRANRAVAEMTEKILATRPPQLTIRELMLTFVLRHGHCLSIGRSVARAMATRKLGTVQFKILTDKNCVDCEADDLIHFGKQFNAFFPACPDAFAGLTVLELHNLRFIESELPTILGTCKRLEYLCLDNCDAGEGSVLKFEHDRLVDLKFFYGEYETLELCRLPKLQRVTCDYWDHDRSPLVFGFVPQFSRLSRIHSVFSNTTLPLSQLLANASSICEMHMDFKSQKIWVRPEIPRVLSPVLGKLRIVNLDNLPERCDISCTMFILEAAPSLEELSITVSDHACHAVLCRIRDVNWKPRDSDFKHDNLAKLTIFGFQSDNNFMGYVAHVIKAAVSINEVSLHDRRVCKKCVEDGVDVGLSRYPRTSEEKDSCIEKITEGLAMASRFLIHFCP